MWRPRGLLLVAALLGGLAASLCLTLLTSVVAYWGPHGHSYFLGGNSALAFSYELAPAFVSAGWTMLALQFRGRRHAVLLGLAAGLIGAGLLVAYWAIAIITGYDFGLGLIMSLLWEIAAPILALTLPQKGTSSAPRRTFDPWWHIAAAVVLLLAITIPTVRLEQCGPALGLPESQRHFVVCHP